MNEPLRSPESISPTTASIILVACVALVFGQCASFSLLLYDDPFLVTDNPLYRPFSLYSLWFSWRYIINQLYMPITYSAWGFVSILSVSHDSMGKWTVNPAPFHLFSVLVHMLNATMVYRLLRELNQNCYANLAGSLLFALHPLQVESVSWVSETKGLLTGFFSLVSLWAMIRWEKGNHSAAPLGELIGWYAIGFICFLAALLSKPSAVTLPLIVGVLSVFWFGRSLISACCWFGLWLVPSALIAYFTSMAQGSAKLDFVSRPIDRPILAFDACAYYAMKLFWPMDLTLFPDHFATNVVSRPTTYVGIALFLLGVAGFLLIVRRSLGLVTVGISAAALLPALNLIPAEFQKISGVADRYAYLAMLGPCFFLSITLGEFRSPTLRAIVVGVLLCLGALSFQQARVWRSSEALFAHTVSVHPKSAEGWLGLGGTYFDQKNYAKAVEHFEHALELAPDWYYVYRSLGHAQFAYGQQDKAIESFRTCVRMKPSFWLGRSSLGDALLQRGDLDGAIEQFELASKEYPYEKSLADRLEKLLKIKAVQEAAKSKPPATSSDGKKE